MASPAQRRALDTYRRRLDAQGLSRFEVLGRQEDKALVRLLARRLAADDAEADRLRAEVSRRLACERPGTGGILAALRRSPLMGADLDLRREDEAGRDVGL